MAGSVRVVSCRAGAAKRVQPSKNAIQIRADRKNSILGNPFVLKDHNDPAERADVIAKQNARIDEDLCRGGEISVELTRIAALVAGGAQVEFICWCAPRPCHADRYVQIVEKLAGIQPAQASLI